MSELSFSENSYVKRKASFIRAGKFLSIPTVYNYFTNICKAYVKEINYGLF
jgi:hypothetical protein